VTAAFQKTE